MSFIGNNPKWNTGKFNPQSADPSNPVEGQTFYSDGTPRVKGLWVYKNGDWVKVAEGSAGNLVVSLETSNFTALPGEDLYIVDSTSGDVTATLFTAAGNTGKVLRFKKTVAANKVIIDPNASETIDGFSTITLYGNNQEVAIVSDGTNWIVQKYDQLFAYLKDAKANNTIGGASVSGRQTRDLNELTGDTTFVTLSSNEFTLDAGKYLIEANTTAYKSNGHQAIIRNTTDATDALLGLVTFSGTSEEVQTQSEVHGVVEITSTKSFALQQYISSANAFGLGNPLGAGLTEVYSQVKITKII